MKWKICFPTLLYIFQSCLAMLNNTWLMRGEIPPPREKITFQEKSASDRSYEATFVGKNEDDWATLHQALHHAGARQFPYKKVDEAVTEMRALDIVDPELFKQKMHHFARRENATNLPQQVGEFLEKKVMKIKPREDVPSSSATKEPSQNRNFIVKNVSSTYKRLMSPKKKKGDKDGDYYRLDKYPFQDSDGSPTH